MGVGLRFHRPVLLFFISINIAYGKTSGFLALLYDTAHRQELGEVSAAGAALPWAFSSCSEKSQIGQDKPLEHSHCCPHPVPLQEGCGKEIPTSRQTRSWEPLQIGAALRLPVRALCSGRDLGTHSCFLHWTLSKRGARLFISPGDSGYFWTTRRPQQEVSHVWAVLSRPICNSK